ncbi:MAG: acyl-CoA dehydrogenase [Myxococcota bacterium]|nr:acyl-CoA dehydrogenase [Myxococcota bacterium]
MLDFSFTPAQEEYRAALRKIALEELLPRYAEGDEERYPHEQIRRLLSFGESFWQDREAERDLISVGITAEEVGRGDFNCVLPALGAPYQSQFFADFSAAQHARWSRPLATGDATIALGITEPGAGSDMGRMESRAERTGDGWLLSGTKNSVSFLNADVFYVFARSDPAASGWHGISAFLVPRETRGLSFEPVSDLGCRAVPRGLVQMQDVSVPDDAIVGEPGTAFVRISRFFDVNRAVIGLKCIGAALQSIDETVARARERIVFGAPMAAHQGVTFPLADAATQLELARLGCYRVLWMRQNDLACQHEGAMVKWYAPKVAAEAIHKCLLLHGHYGYSRDLPLQQRLRDVIGWQIGDGSEEVMKLLIVRSLFSPGAGGRDVR